MPKLLKDAIEVDKVARQKVEEANDQKEKIHETIKAKKDVIYKELMDDVKKQTDDFQKELDKKINAQKAENDKEVAQSIKELDAKYEENHEAWIGSIVDNVKNH